MINDYKKAVDSIIVSEELQNNTIMKLKNKSIEKNRAKVPIHKQWIIAACFVTAVIAIVTFNRGTIFVNKNIITKNPQNQIVKNNKETMQYAPDTVQARILKEKAITIDSSATVDRIAPKSKNIEDRYANSQNVIKGYVYGTEYFWYSNNTFTQLYTKSVITIKKSYKGALKSGDKLTVIEHGGVATLRDWIEKTSVKEYKDFEKVPENYDPYNGKSPDTLIDYAGFLGITPMRTGQDVVLFLVPSSNEFYVGNNESGYSLVESDGGKMVLENGIYKTKISPDNLVKAESCAESEIDNLIHNAAATN